MNNKLPYIIGGGLLLVLIAFLMNGTQATNKTQSISHTPLNTSSNTSPKQEPQDVVPGFYDNPIKNTATKDGFAITKSLVENNTDANGKTIDDHLELALKNTSGQDLKDFEMYYTVTDQTTNKKEGYYKKLKGFVLKNGQTQSLNFDNMQGDGHFGINKSSMYYTSSNKLFFDVTISTQGYKMQTVKITKDAGGAEVKD